MKDIRQYLISEDSLDDFDIDGSIARKRNAVPQAEKQKVHTKIQKRINDISRLCKEFFKMKNIKMTQSDEYLSSNKFVVYFPDLGWGFTYKPTDRVSFEIAVGQYGRIDQEKDYTQCENILKELSEYLKQNMKNVENYVSVWKDSINGFTSAAWMLRIGISVKNL